MKYLLSALFLFTSVSTAQDASVFRQGLDALSSHTEKKQWQEALDGLAKLLAANERSDWAFAARSELVRLDRICRFRLQAKEVADQDLIRGKILRLNKSKGSIKLRYDTNARFDDFTVQEPAAKTRRRGERVSKLRIHPAVFRDIKITIEGDGYSFARLLLAMTDDGHYDCIVGTPPPESGIGSYFPSSASLFRAGKSKQVSVKHWGANDAKSKLRFPMKAGEKFRLLVRVGKTISIRYKHKTVLSFANKLGNSGSFAFDIVGVQSVEIDGRFDPSWLQNKRDAAIQKQRAAFEKTYDARKTLPAWLFAVGSSGPEIASGKASENSAKTKGDKARKFYPGELAQSEIPRFNKLIGSLNAGDNRTLLFRIAALPKGVISEDIRDWLRAHAYHALGSAKSCLKYAERLRKSQPDFAAGHLLAAMSHASMLKTDAAMVALSDAQRADASDAKIYSAAVQLAMRTGQGREAARWLESARRAGVELPDGRKFEGAVRKLLHGPEWTTKFRVENADYTIESDIDKKICQDAAKVLSSGLKFYKKDLGWKLPSAAASSAANAKHGAKGEAEDLRFRVYLFAGKKGFETYQQSFGETPVHNPAGLFDPMLRQLLIWNLPSRKELLRTVRHEGFHQFLDRALPNAPAWLNEGLAEYYERSRYELGPPRLGAVHPSHLALLARKGAVPHVAKFMRISRKNFYKNAHINYARAWALVHFLRRGPSKWRRVFDRFVTALREGSSRLEAVEQALQGSDLSAMHDAWRAHLETLASK